MKRSDKLACPVLQDKGDERLAIGGKIGDPYGITLKYYLPKKWGFEVIAGMTFAALANQDVERNFVDNPPKEFESVTYISHAIPYPISIQARVVRHGDLYTDQNLYWYAGAGFNYRLMNVVYIFQFEEQAPLRQQVTEQKRPIHILGPEVSLGTEYFLKKTPITVFAEVGLFYDITGQLTSPRFQGGMGVRWNL